MDQALSGMISGVSTITSGRPGEDSRIQIRGINSLSGSSDPIWIVDGMPLQGEAPVMSGNGRFDESLFQSGIGNISPDDIESITVLKDAAATAIYGARAANGVIVVKTKSGHAGKTRYNVTARFSVRERPHNNVRMMNSAEKIEFERQVYNDLGIYDMGRVMQILHLQDNGYITPQDAEQQIDRLRNINTDWFKALYRNSLSSQVNVSMSGGSSKTLFYNSLAFLSENGVERNNAYNRLRFSSKINHSVNDKLRFETELSATYRTDKRTASGIPTLQYALYANPYETPDGYDLSWVMRETSMFHPGAKWQTLNVLNEINNNTASTRYMDASLRLKIDWAPVKGMNISSQSMITGNNNNYRSEFGEHTYTNYNTNWLGNILPELTPDMAKGALSEGNTYGAAFTVRNTVEYSFDLKDEHFFTFFGGHEISGNIAYTSQNYAPMYDKGHRIIGFPKFPEGTDANTVNLRQLVQTARGESRLSSFFLNGSYSYKDRYVIGGSVRYDGSDIIGNKNQFTPLWNVSGRWNLHNEPFIHSKMLNRLSVKMGYGYTGSIDKSAHPFVLMMYGDNLLYDGQVVPSSFTYANPNVKWQTKRDFNVGVEGALWRNRVNFSVNFYNNLVFDLLDMRRLPYSSGQQQVRENVANIRNRGWEFDLSADVYRRKGLIVNLRGNLAINKNIVTKTYIKSLADLGRVDPYTANENPVQGYARNSWFGYHFAGVDKITGHTLAYDDEGKKVDLDMVGNVGTDSKLPTASYLGELYAPVTGGLSLNITWNRLMFSTNLEFKMGNKIQSFNTFKGLDVKNRHISDMGRWRSPGDVATIPQISLSDNAYSNYLFDAMLEKGDYLRNTYCSLTYRIPEKLLHPLRLETAQIAFTANNLFTVTAYKGIDPALMGQIGYPNSRNYTLSLNVNF